MENDFISNTSQQEMMTEFAVGYCHKKRTQDDLFLLYFIFHKYGVLIMF